MPTTLGILDLAARGLVTSTVLLVNSPHAVAAVRAYHKAGVPLELGWHPCLTLDRPVLPPHQVPSLVGPDGCFWPLNAFMRRLCLGRIHVADIEAELLAQYALFCDLAGHPPTVVNSHHHVQVLQPVGAVLLHVLEKCRPLPYVRRVREPWLMLARLPGARGKRAFLCCWDAVGRACKSAEASPGTTGSPASPIPTVFSDANFLALAEPGSGPHRRADVPSRLPRYDIAGPRLHADGRALAAPGHRIASLAACQFPRGVPASGVYAGGAFGIGTDSTRAGGLRERETASEELLRVAIIALLFGHHVLTPGSFTMSNESALPDVVMTTKSKPREQNHTRRLPPYNVIIDNDDYHSFEFVAGVLSKALGFASVRAHQLTLQAHTTGRAVVWTGPKEVAELKVDQIRSFHEIRRPDGAELGPLDCSLEPAPGG